MKIRPVAAVLFHEDVKTRRRLTSLFGILRTRP